MKTRFAVATTVLLMLVGCGANKADTAYVFTYFNNSRQDAGLFLAYSYDGFKWTAVNDNKPVFRAEVGKNHIMRDPSVCQGPDGIFHLVWTVSWNAGSIGHAWSADLVHWNDQKEVPVMEAFPSTRNSWAPELFYDEGDGLFYIFWASTVPDSPDVSTDGCISESDYNHRIYCTATRDFESFTPTRLWFNPDFNAIDAAVTRVPGKDELIMVVKNENLHPAEKNIRLTRSKSMEEGFPTEVSAPISGIGMGEDAWAEGPSPLYVGKDLVVFYDLYRQHKYGASISHDDGVTWEDATDRIRMPEGISHGTALAVERKVVDKLAALAPNLVPLVPSEAPDYLCTWNLQCYRSDQAGPVRNRAEMNEANLFGHGPWQDWLSMYPAVREDLFFVMDDSWDIPADCNGGMGVNPYLGTVRLDVTRFPSFTGAPAERLKTLADSVCGRGWKGLGGWICAQKADSGLSVPDAVYWKERLEEADAAGIRYWKVDWGKEAGNGKWREQLTQWGRRYARDLVIEHAMNPEFISFSDTYRTYDVENITAQTVTIDRVAEYLPYAPEGEAKGVINCEDEPYIAAGLGCAIGIMRHPFVGDLPNGGPDTGFPKTGRNLKKRLDEVVRGVRWHRIAEPFGSDGVSFSVDTVRLEDGWLYCSGESWIHHDDGETIVVSAPARVSRNMPLPKVDSDDPARPFVLATRYPNDAVAVTAVGRSLGREYVLLEVPVEVDVPAVESPVGVFGRFRSLTLNYPSTLGKVKVWAQDLADSEAVDITSRVKVDGNRLVIPGSVIAEAGLSAATEGDNSDPGMVLKLLREM